MMSDGQRGWGVERERLLREGIALHQAGRLAEAEHRYGCALRLVPGDPAALRLLGLVRHAQGDVQLACSYLEQATQAMPEPPAGILCEYGHALLDAGRAGPAREVLQRAVSRDGRDVRAWNLLGNALAASASNEAAADAFKTATELDPAFPLAWHNLATALQFLGRTEEALETYEKLLSMQPEFPCIYNYARLRRFEAHDPMLHTLRERWARGGDIVTEERIDLGFGLAKALDDVGDYAEAFSVLCSANAAKRSLVVYASADTSKGFAELRERVCSDWLRDVILPDAGNLRPIFIVGMPRSGSTLVEQILASHRKVRAGGELPFLPQAIEGAAAALMEGAPDAVSAALQQVRETYLAAVRGRLGDVHCFTDKLPENFMFIPFIRAAFPEARVVHVHREPIATCLSCFERHFTVGQAYAYDLDELADYYCEYSMLMSDWISVLPQGAIHELTYEDLIEDTAAQVHRLLDHCGLDWEDGCLRFHETKRSVTTASASQVRRPIYDTSVARWKRYADQLAPVRARLDRCLK